MVNRRHVRRVGLIVLIAIVALLVAHEVNFAGSLVEVIKTIHGG